MLELLYFKDMLEIIFFSVVMYYFCIWLKKDKRHNLLIYFYGYWGCFCVASLIHLPTITAFLLYSSPLAVLLFIIFHQDILQRNFVTLQNKPLSTMPENFDWIENLIRMGLSAINNRKQLLCVIEHRSDLKPFLETSIIFNSPLHQNLLALLLDTPQFDQDKMLWCNTQGKLVALNTVWKIGSSSWQHDALLMTLKTDTLVFKANPTTRSFDIIAKGILYETVSAHHAIPLIKKHIFGIWQGDMIHDTAHKKSFFEQQNR